MNFAVTETAKLVCFNPLFIIEQLKLTDAKWCVKIHMIWH